MKRLALAALMALTGGALWAADPVEGVWKTRPDDNGNFGYVRIAPCGDRLCGVLIRAFDKTGAETHSDNIGRKIVWDMTPDGAGGYGGGQVWAPDRDKTYASKMVLSGDTLSVSGCVLGGLICRAQDWTRVK
ncbi:MAG: DUF2147 domain-containing protein [Proteobacteria bacterium]|nr:DUF2147 domain-containing protein [Pseudomonadota bacterium]MBS0572313.1 DUF2147 domain-containing protein [Pseudomonadota bacterium]